MCHVSCILFGAINLKREEIEGKKIIEVGSYDVNGSVRSLIEFYKPKEYVGVDIMEGPGVDIVCNVEKTMDKFGKENFDVVISTELLEHVRDWRKVISNIKNICVTGGIILITTRSKGFPYHAYPYDFWRYELEDMQNIFSDCEILVLEKDPRALGVFVKVKKPNNFVEKNLSNYKLYSIVANKKVVGITDKDFKNLYFIKLILKQKVKSVMGKVIKFIFSKT
jgi:SAM-dependent methyltransferase